jgi:broad specificity phosphatase PhoE
MILLRHGQSEFNVVFNATRRDPGIADPALTPVGRDQALAAARTLAAERISHIIVSPYTRALQTAAIVAETLGLSIHVVTPEVRERYAFSCDVGTPASRLAESWPGLDFSGLDEIWWPSVAEPGAGIEARAKSFRDRMAAEKFWAEALVVSHWGFILSLIGERVQNGEIRRCDPRDKPPAITWHH